MCVGLRRALRLYTTIDDVVEAADVNREKPAKEETKKQRKEETKSERRMEKRM